MNLSHLCKPSLLRAWFVSVCAFIIGSLAVITQYLWNPDPHHDGIMFTAAIAVKDGLLPNRDFFAQYGPLSPFIQGLSLSLFGHSLTGLRMFMAFLLITTAAMLGYRTLQIFGSKYAILVFLIWSLTGPMGLPWSSILSTFLLTFVLFASFSVKNRELTLRPRVFLITSQLLVLGILIRVHLIAVITLISIVLVFYRKLFPNKLYLKWFVLSGLNIAISVSALHGKGILSPYIEQSFVWAFEHYASPVITFSYLSGLIWFFLVPVTVMIMARSVNLVQALPKILRVLLLSALFAINTAILVYVSNTEKTDSDSLFDINYFMFELLRRILLVLNYLPLMFSVIMFLLLIFKKLPTTIKLNQNYLLVASITIGTLAQLYPLFDPWHLWMVSPIFLVAAVLILMVFTVSQKSDFGITSVSIVILTALSINFVSNLNSQTYSFKSSILQGMSSSRNDAVYLDRTLIKIEKYVKKEEEIVFLCGDGLYAAANGHFLSKGFMFVDWGIDSPKVTRETELIFLCEVTRSSIETYLRNGWTKKFIEPNGHVNFENALLFNSLIERQLDE